MVHLKHKSITMLHNPTVEIRNQNEKERREKEAFRYPFIVTCVVRYTEDLPNTPSFKLVRTFCENNHVAFSAREYDSHRYSEDCNFIEKLPAFHLYYKNGREHYMTFYGDQNPVQKILEEIGDWKKEQEKRKARKEAWDRRITGLISFFEGLSFKKKPKLIVPERPKSLPAKVPVQLPDALPKNRRGSQ